jgi:uncharacterized protein (DUF1697 family)
MVRERKAIESVIRNNPFEGNFESHKQMHVLFMNEEMPQEKQELLSGYQTERDKVAIRGREIYTLLLDGVAESTLMRKNIIEGKLKIPITGRNWRTVEKLIEL